MWHTALLLGRIAFFIDVHGVIRRAIEGMPDNKKALADIEGLIE